MASQKFLVVSESFYSVQGEGPFVGVPAVFLRLAGCNLQCEGFSYRDPKTGEHLGCDTKLVWRLGQKQNFETILVGWEQKGWLDKLHQGAHLIITGGEPLLQQKALASFIDLLRPDIFIEMETNGTLLPQDSLLQRIHQFNVSPKLTNSGEPLSRVYCAETLKAFWNTQKAIFKFVISTPANVTEVLNHFMHPLQLSPRKIWLMPEGGTREQICEKKTWLVELCKQHLFNFTSRLQVDIWEAVTGV